MILMFLAIVLENRGVIVKTKPKYCPQNPFLLMKSVTLIFNECYVKLTCYHIKYFILNEILLDYLEDFV